jgi:hypothetical protein
LDKGDRDRTAPGNHAAENAAGGANFRVHASELLCEDGGCGSDGTSWAALTPRTPSPLANDAVTINKGDKGNAPSRATAG